SIALVVGAKVKTEPSPSRGGGGPSASCLHHAGHAAHAAHPAHAGAAVRVAGVLVLVLGRVADHAVAGEQQGGDAGGVLQGGAVDLGRRDDALLHHVAVLER